MTAVLHPGVRSVLVVRLRVGLGDLLCGVPALRALRTHLPDAHVALLTWPEMAPVVARQRAYVDELVAFPGHPGIPERPPEPGAYEPWVQAMRARRFDVAIQAYGLRPAAGDVTLDVGARRSAGFFSPGAWAPPEDDLDAWLPYPEHVHEVERHLALLELLGAPRGSRELEFPTTAQDDAQAAAVRARLGDAAFVLLHPGATSPSRQWPTERFAAVGDALAARGLRVGVTGVPGEEERTAAVVAAMRAPAVDLCGATSLGAYAALLRDAALLVCNDTGSAHLASAMRTPSVVCFLSGDPVRWAAPHARHRVARVQVECNPCGNLSCPIDHRCAQRLTVDRVLAEAELALGAAARA